MKIFILFISMLLLCSFSKANTESSYIVMETTTKTVIKANNEDKQMLIASTAKILTALTVIENYDLDELVFIKDEYTKAVGSSVYLSKGDYVSRYDLLHALMLRSANDAASALSDNNNSEFIMKMNELAKKIGMKNSIFTNASGLDEKEYNLSTAYDMGLLASYASANEIFTSISSMHTYKATTNDNSYTWINKHKLVTSDESFFWGKTGYTKKAHRILVSNYLKDDINVVIVTINNNDDWNFHKKSINELDDYSFIKLYDKGLYEIVLDKSYYLVVDSNIVIAIKKDDIDDINYKLEIIGSNTILKIYLNSKLICFKNLRIYDKNSIDIDLLVELYL